MNTDDQCQPMRMKYWKELSEPEKIERMRDIVRSLRAEVNRLSRDNNALVKHRHGADGEPVVKLEQREEFPRLRYDGGEEDYF